jgi:hypothetical protein
MPKQQQQSANFSETIQNPLENEEGWITRPVSLVVPMSQSML